MNFFFLFQAKFPTALYSSCMTAKSTAGARVHSTPGIKLQKRDNRIWDCQARFRPFRNMSHKVDIRAAGRPRDMGVSPNQFLVDMITHGRTADAFRYVLPPINWWPFCSEQLQRQIVHQNARIFKRNWLIPAIFLFQLMAKPNQANSWFPPSCHSTPYKVHGP